MNNQQINSELTLLQECGKNILKNIDNCLALKNMDQGKVSRLLSMRYYLVNELESNS